LGRPTKEKTGIKDLEILKRLALDGPLSRYEISIEKQRILIRYPTVWRRLVNDKDSLLRTGLVEEVKDTRPRKYTLTELGLLKLLSHYPEQLKSRMSQITKRWSSLLPPLFRKWSYLKSRGVENEMIEILKRLRWRMDLMIPLLSSDPETEQYKEYLLERFIRLPFFYRLFRPQVSEVALAWYKAIRDDPQLKEWMINNLKDEISTIRSLGEVYEQSLRTIEASEEPNLGDVENTIKTYHEGMVMDPRFVEGLAILEEVVREKYHRGLRSK